MNDEEIPTVSYMKQLEIKYPQEAQMRKLAEFKSKLSLTESPKRSWWGEFQTRLSGIGLGRTR